MASVTSRDRWTLILIVIIIIMGLEIIYLVHRNRQLRAIIEDPKRYFQTLTDDDTVPSIIALDIQGNEIRLDYSPSAPYTVLFWFSPSCSSCEENIDFWNMIYKGYGSGNLRYSGMFIGSPDEAGEFVSEHGIEFPVLCAADPFIVSTYKGNVLPQTMLISPEGVILGVWPGAVEGEPENRILARLEEL